MNRQPYQTPPQWWSPRLSSRWVRFWRPFRRRRGLHEHGLTHVEVRGTEHLRAALATGQGVLITPNHPAHADPYVLMEVSDQIGAPFYFMTAWQVFAMTHWLGRQVLRQHGAFSINREGTDLRALRQAVDILEQGTHPLVMFPEGEVFHLNDRVTHFRRGAVTIALRAARRAQRPVACLPCGMKYKYVEDPMPRLLELMARLEQRMSWQPLVHMPLAKRVLRVGEGVLTMKEMEYFGATRAGNLAERASGLMHALLGRLEDRYALLAVKPTIPERVKQLRLRAINRMELSADVVQREQARRDLDELFFVNQLFSYPPGYLIENASVERLAETLDKLEEDLLQVRTANKRGLRKAIVSFGPPVLAEPGVSRHGAAEMMTETLQQRVQQQLDAINSSEYLPARDERLDLSPPDSAASLQLS